MPRCSPFTRCLASLIIALVCSTSARGVEQWGIFEVALKGPATGNPFVDVHFSATFTNGPQSHEVEGFYDGNGIYRVRFMPETQGAWRYETHSNIPALSGSIGAFTVTQPLPGDYGPVRVHDTYHFAYADGTPYRELGTTSYSWCQQSDAVEDLTVAALAQSPFNKIRMCVLPQNEPDSKPEQFPFAGTPPRQWDYTRFDPLFFQRMERRVGQLRDLGIEADLILFHPYDKEWGFDKMDAPTRDRYLHYVIARFGAYRNVWWSLANEFDLIHAMTDADWDHAFQLVQSTDPYGHLRSIHNSKRFYNNALPWVTHASIQNGSAVKDPGRAELYRDVWRKPVVYDEVKYEGNIRQRWGQLTGQEMVERFWSGVVAGTYVGHSECLPDATGGMWLNEGRVLRGQSPPRLAFLRKVLDDSPPDGIDPIDPWQDTRMGGQPGKYYLLYFGTDAPASWTFRLYKDGLAGGMKFKVDILDTWAMTITPVDGDFVTKKADNYTFVDATARSIPLPSKPYLALRIRRVGG